MINKSKTKEPMPVQSSDKRVNNFDEVELGLGDEAALKEAQRCLGCKAHPCTFGCPVGVRIPEFIRFLAQGDVLSARNVICKSNPFPAICARVCPQEKQCEALCIRGKSGEPVGIGRLERYAADKFLNCSLKKTVKDEDISSGPKHKIAIVGSGPSGLACAARLAELGFKVTVFEALHTVGGVLAYGIPEFRLPREVLAKEFENFKKSGVTILKDVVIGKSFSIDDLFLQGFNAIYISCGAGLPRLLSIPGEGLPGVYCANEFLTRINLMKAYKEEYDTPIVHPENVVVIGGGNVAMDAARCAKRLNPKKVTVVYRRSQEEMPARKDEILHAKEEGIEFLFLSNPTRFYADDLRVSGVKYVKMKLCEADSSGRRSVIPDSDKEYEICADTVIVAAGNLPNSLIKDSNCKIKFDSKGRIIINPETMQTSRPFVYAGGDSVTGAATVILAMGAGKKAAEQINRDLKAKDISEGKA